MNLVRHDGSGGERHQEKQRLQRRRHRAAEEQASKEKAAGVRASSGQHHERETPECGPEVVRAEFERLEKVDRQQRQSERRPHTNPFRVQPRAENAGRPQDDREEDQHRSAHVQQDVRPLAEEAQDRRRHHVEEGRVIVEEIAILKEARRPAPRDVQMLRLVGVEAVAIESDGPQHGGGRGEQDQQQSLAVYSSHRIEGGAP